MTALASLLAQWRENRRLRVALGIAALIGVLNLVSAIDLARESTIRQYKADRGLLMRLEGAAADEAWRERAASANEQRAALEASLTRVAGPGEAQAELQAQLVAAAAAAGLPDARVRTEGAVAVEGQPDVLQVVARLDSPAAPASAEALLREIAGRLWMRVERVEVRDGAPGQVQMIVAGHFLVGETP